MMLASVTASPPIEMVFEPIEPALPRSAEWRQPLVKLHEGLGANAVEALLGVDSDFDQASVAKYPQMLRHCRLAHAEMFH
jgi:hypothetical protein